MLLELAEKEEKPPQMLGVERKSRGQTLIPIYKRKNQPWTTQEIGRNSGGS